MKSLLPVFAALAALAAAAPAFAQEDGAKLYQEKTCWSCHGKDAKTPLLPEYPKIAGQNAQYAERQMLDIKSGARANGNSAAMNGIMVLVNEKEIKAIAEYVSKLKP
ncbi:MAG: c-type cytochrome [Burkholderiaceae bacterium]|nr:c-type cytochrome [Burkholderiaceae bacterium]